MKESQSHISLQFPFSPIEIYSSIIELPIFDIYFIPNKETGIQQNDNGGENCLQGFAKNDVVK